MKKKLLLIVCGILFSSLFAFSQNESLVDARTKSGLGSFKATLPTDDKTETIDITGSKLASISVSNTADGSLNSYKHALRIVLSLTNSNPRSAAIQLVFYANNESIQYAEFNDKGTINIYYPSEVYETIRQRLDESFNARKKVQVKIVEKTNGYREGTLIF